MGVNNAELKFGAWNSPDLPSVRIKGDCGEFVNDRKFVSAGSGTNKI